MNIKKLSKEIHANALKKGFWDNKIAYTDTIIARSIGDHGADAMPIKWDGSVIAHKWVKDHYEEMWRRK